MRKLICVVAGCVAVSITAHAGIINIEAIPGGDTDYIYENSEGPLWQGKRNGKEIDPRKSTWAEIGDTDPFIDIDRYGKVNVDWNHPDIRKHKHDTTAPIVYEVEFRVTERDGIKTHQSVNTTRRIELVFDITRDVRDKTQMADNLRRNNLNTFMMSAPDDSVHFLQNRSLYGATLTMIADLLVDRSVDLAHANEGLSRTLTENSTDPADMKTILEGIRDTISSDENHPLRNVALWQYFTADQTADSDQVQREKREYIFELLHDLAHLGIEIPFLGCVDRRMATWLFTSEHSEFIADSANGIGRLVEHNYYTTTRSVSATRNWYVDAGKEAGILKYLGTNAGTPDYSVERIGQPPHNSAPISGPSYDCAEFAVATNHDSSKDNGDCCCGGATPHWCCDDWATEATFCSIFENECTLASDPCSHECGTSSGSCPPQVAK